MEQGVCQDFSPATLKSWSLSLRHSCSLFVSFFSQLWPVNWFLLVLSWESTGSHFYKVAIDIQYTCIKTSLSPERTLYRPIIAAFGVRDNRIHFLKQEITLESIWPSISSSCTCFFPRNLDSLTSGGNSTNRFCSKWRGCVPRAE